MSAQRVQVSLELVLAVDVSASVDGREYALQMHGIAAAFRNKSVISAIERLGNNGIAVALVHWSQNYATRTVVPFVHVYDAHTARQFAVQVAVVRRRTHSGFTAAGAAIVHSVNLLETNDFVGVRRTIDISGDGRSNAHPLPHGPRMHAQQLGIIINGLAIATGDGGLVGYYSDEVITGAGSFVELARDYTVIAPVMLRKLLREIAPPMTRFDPTRPYHRGLPGLPQYRTTDLSVISRERHGSNRIPVRFP